MGQVGHDVCHAEQFTPRPFERVRSRIGRVPLRDDVVVGRVGLCESWRNEVGRRRVALRPFTVHGVEQAVLRKLRVKVEPDESALQPVVDRERKGRAHIGVHRGLFVAVEQIQEAARVVGEPAPVRQVADKADARPAGRHDVLIWRAEPARVRQARHVSDLDHQAALLHRRRNRVGDLRVNGRDGTQREQRDDDQRFPCAHESSSET